MRPSSRRVVRRAARVADLPVAALLVALVAVACGASAPTPAPSAGTPAVAPSGPTAGAAATAGAPSLAPSAPPSAAPATVPAGVAMEDPSLLGVLPAEVAGQPVVLESQAFADAIADEAFAGNVEAAAFGIAVSGDDLASAVVARPVPGAFSEAWFRDWRDSYDRGACGQAGGVAGVAESTVGERTVYVATCGGGLRTYHTWLDGPGLVISVLAVGEGRYGERLMAGLRP